MKYIYILVISGFVSVLIDSFLYEDNLNKSSYSIHVFEKKFNFLNSNIIGRHVKILLCMNHNDKVGWYNI